MIFVVAYRRKVISSRVLQRLIEISDVFQREQSELLECSGERDHVHRLISYPPKLCLSELIRKLKAISSLKIRREFNGVIRHLLWGKRFWTKSYSVISVGHYPSPRSRTGNSAASVKDVALGLEVIYSQDGQLCTLIAKDNIPACHKVAIKRLLHRS